jgi:hypothetical protein
MMTDSFRQRTSAIRLPFLEGTSVVDRQDDVIGTPSKRLESQVVAQSFTDIREVVDALHLDAFQLFLVSDTRVQEKVGCLECSAGHDQFLFGSNNRHFA